MKSKLIVALKDKTITKEIDIPQVSNAEELIKWLNVASKDESEAIVRALNYGLSMKYRAIARQKTIAENEV